MNKEICAVLVVFIILTILVGLFEDQKKPMINEKGDFELRTSKFNILQMSFSFLFFISTGLFSLKEDVEYLGGEIDPIRILLLISMVILAIIQSLEMINSRIVYNEKQLEKIDLLNKKKVISLDKIDKFEITFTTLKLFIQTGEKLKIRKHYKGYKHFEQFLIERTAEDS